MRLASWNINGMNARLQYALRFLREESPDVVGLQELKMVDERLPRDAFHALGYHVASHGQKSWNGVAVLSRAPAEVTQVGLPGQEALGARLLSVKVEGIDFTTVYCPNGKSLDHADFGRKLAWFDALADHIDSRYDRDDALVLCGDFNIVPAAIDSWDEAALAGQMHHTAQERARLARLEEWGLVDLWRRARPDEPGHTWWDYRRGAFHKRQGLRLDLVLGTAAVARRLTGAHVERRWRRKIDGMTASDHAPVWVDLDPSRGWRPAGALGPERT